MQKETETEKTIIFFVTYLSLVAIQLGERPLAPPPLGYAYALKLRNLNLSLCGHLDRISDRLLRVVSLSDLRMAISSFRHNLQRPLPQS